MTDVRGRVVVGLLAGALLGDAFPLAALALARPAPRCHVVPDTPPSGRAGAAGTGATAGAAIVVEVPRVVCDNGHPPVVGRPSGEPVRLPGGGTGAGRGTGTPTGGPLPFTGEDLARWLAVGLVGTAAGSVLVLAGRRRRRG